MHKVSTTRMELLAKKAQIALATQGRELLEEKRTALVREFMRVADRVLAGSDTLQNAAAEARRALARAEAVAGTEAVRSAAMATRGELAIEVRAANVMGVNVPVIEQKRVTRSVLARGYSISGTSVTIDEAAAAFEAEVDSVIQLAESELRLTRLASEIQRTSRRVNALEHVLIPRLIAERDYIQMALDERERADHFRLKRVKRALERDAGQKAS
ncbi:MAG: V-type ATP synthase subunit D [Chloroflexi bacterium]|nr:V-type ATP synthase subunit D [Chloroflexota bacterium]MBI3763576.1 V-type ATP synthase subunit D [Chloroflexota bacterium]